MNVTSVGLNGVIELLVPTLLFLFFSRAFYSTNLRMLGITADVPFWRRTAWLVLGLVTTLIVCTYGLNLCVKLGVYGPLHIVKHPSDDEQDYSHYAAYDTSGGAADTPPAPQAPLPPLPPGALGSLPPGVRRALAGYMR